MKQRFGIVASYIPVIFTADGKTVYETQGSVGCMRQGEPEDSYNLIRQALAQKEKDVLSGKAGFEANMYDAVTVQNRSYTRRQLVEAGVIEAPKKTICFPFDPRSNKRK